MRQQQRIAVRQTPAGPEFLVKAVPGASRTTVAGAWGEALRVAVAAPAEGGRANAALVDLLAKVLNVRRSAVQIVDGQTRPVKRVRVVGLAASAVAEKLANAVARRC